MNEDIPNSGLIMGHKLYDKLKATALVVLPALGSLYFALGNIWSWPNVEEVIGSITAIDTFLGALVGISSASYNRSNAKYDGSLNVITSEEGNKVFSLELDGDPEELEHKDAIMFRIKND
jgi:hypothetical protein